MYTILFQLFVVIGGHLNKGSIIVSKKKKKITIILFGRLALVKNITHSEPGYTSRR